MRSAIVLAVIALIGSVGYYIATQPLPAKHDVSISVRPFLNVKDGAVTVGLHPIKRD